MNLTSEFLKAMQSGATGTKNLAPGKTTLKKNTKKRTNTGDSFTSEFLNALNKLEREEIAPVSSRVTSRMTADKEDEDIAPVQSSDDRKWFQKGLFDDGYDVGDITRTILGTGSDIMSDLGTGILGMGEKAVDAVAGIAPAVMQAQFNQSTEGFATPAVVQRNDNAVLQSQQILSEFAKKDLYDEEAVSKQILSSLYGAAHIANITQSGGQVTKADLESSKAAKEQALNYLENQMEAESVLGEKSDALVQSAGQLAAQYGLQLAGVPWYLTTGLTSFGGEFENALNEGATYEEATASAAIAAGAEILSEKLFDADLFTKKAGPGMAANYLTRAISNKTLRTLAKLGVDAAGEGFEEVFSQVMSNLGTALYREENLRDILFSEQAMNEYLESYIGGAVMGGGMGSISALQSNAAGMDYTSGLTANEEAVIKKVYNDLLAEEAKNGKVSEKRQAELYNNVIKWMEKGYISTDTIEEVLGGEAKIAYDEIAKEAAEFDRLYKTESGKLTEEQKDRLAELKDRNIQAPYAGRLQTAKSNLMELVKNDRLLESYNERSRKGEAFEADLSQYDAKQQETIQRAVDSGILNNSNATHEFVDLVAKISADKGVAFDFTNNEKLKESGFSLEGKVVNGYVSKDGVTLNINSAKALNSVVGHEITHVLEGTEMYDVLKNSINEYAKSKGDYQGRYDSLTKLYDGLDTDIEAELTADLVGDYLFTDVDFIRNLSTENRDVFQKIWDEIKYLCKVATAGGKEARELEKVKKVFEDAYRKSGAQKQPEVKTVPSGEITEAQNEKGLDAKSEVQYSLAKDTEYADKAIAMNNSSMRVDNNVLTAAKEIAPSYSLSEEGAQQTEYGDNNVYGKDIGLAQDIAPVAETQMPEKESLEDLAPVRSERETAGQYAPAEDVASIREELEELYQQQEALESKKDSDDVSKTAYDAVTRRIEQLQNKLDADIAPTPEEVNPYGENLASVWENSKTELENNRRHMDQALAVYDEKIQNLQERYDAKKNKNTKAAQDLLRQIERQQRLRSDAEADWKKRIQNNETRAKKAETAYREWQRSKQYPKQNVASVLETKSQKPNQRSMTTKAVTNFIDKGMVFENLSLETGNMELQSKWDFAIPSKAEARAQRFMERGNDNTKSLAAIVKEVGTKDSEFSDYLYHLLNIDRMTLETRFGLANKTVFGETVTAEDSRQIVRELEKEYPEFKKYAEDVYDYNRNLRAMLVDGGMITQETADLWEKMYPHYVPISRDVDGTLVPRSSKHIGVTSPVKKATGGSANLNPLLQTMADRTIQTYKALARNDFGVELKNTLNAKANTQASGMDEIIDSLDAQSSLLGQTEKGKPTFSVFENGQRVTFEITEDMLDALKPTSEGLAYRNQWMQKASNARRNLLTSWNPVFALYRNPVKDLQEVFLNSQHPVKTYLNIPVAAKELWTNGSWATEYLDNGGESNTYYDKNKGTFGEKESVIKKYTGIGAIEKAGDFIEKIPRLAEYIASRQEGRTVQRSMLDSARVTTNFAAGGDVTKFLNAHGFTFLNASVQGTLQHVRNIREAKMNGLKGTVQMIARYTIAGLPGILLNHLLWDDDEEYEELSDYVKQNYYVIAKTKDGKFIRIPKGRTAAVVQNGLEQMANLITGDDEADFQTFFDLFMNNIAPNNPLENNILAPIFQVANNKTWYGDDLVPSRLADLPEEEQFDESTDAISKWLGETVGYSPVKINYLLDQYSGGLGDVILPMLTPEAESGDTSFIGKLIAPWKKEMTTDSVLNNKYPSEFYDLRDEIEIIANGKNATQEDRLKNEYLDAVGWDMSSLYAEKREIQSSDLPDDEKYKQVREIQAQINALAEEAIKGYEDVFVKGLYSEVGNRRFNYSEETDTWYEISDGYYYDKEQEVTKELGISYSQYWNNRAEYNFAYDQPEKYKFLQENDISYAQYIGFNDTTKDAWDWAYKNPESFEVSKAISDNVVQYRKYISDLYDLKADKDANGKSISGTKKTKVINYINNMDADYGQKIILFKSQYPADDTYNYDIVEYLNSRDDISYAQMETILKELGFEVDEKGNISW